MDEAQEKLLMELVKRAQLFMTEMNSGLTSKAVPMKYTDYLNNDWGDCAVLSEGNESMLMPLGELKGSFVYTNGTFRVIILGEESIILQKLNPEMIGPNGILSEGTIIQ